MRLRMILKGFLALGIVSLSSVVLASPDLIIHNKTDFYSTVITNDGACSSNIKNRGGITPPQQDKTFDSRTLRAACLTNTENCKADAFLTDHCNIHDPDAKVIATVIFSVNSGIKSKTNTPNSGYCLKGTGFEVTLEPNPTNQPCVG